MAEDSLSILQRFYYHKGCCERIPDMKDAQLPIGIVEYFAGISSPLISWAVRLYDLDPSTESGIHRIALAADEGHWSG